MAQFATRRWLLPFHREILQELIPTDDEENDALLILSPGLGMRRILSSFLRVYSNPNNLVLILNASPRDMEGISNDLGILGLPHGAINHMHHELGAKQRREMYLSGGLQSVTSRILVVDMLNNTIPTEMVTGIVILHAERCVLRLTE